MGQEVVVLPWRPRQARAEGGMGTSGWVGPLGWAGPSGEGVVRAGRAQRERGGHTPRGSTVSQPADSAQPPSQSFLELCFPPCDVTHEGNGKGSESFALRRQGGACVRVIRSSRGADAGVWGGPGPS